MVRLVTVGTRGRITQVIGVDRVEGLIIPRHILHLIQEAVAQISPIPKAMAILVRLVSGDLAVAAEAEALLPIILVLPGSQEIMAAMEEVAEPAAGEPVAVAVAAPVGTMTTQVTGIRVDTEMVDQQALLEEQVVVEVVGRTLIIIPLTTLAAGQAVAAVAALVWGEQFLSDSLPMWPS